MKTIKRKSVEANNKKYVELIQEIGKKAEKQGLLNLDFLDQISDEGIVDEPIPFPYGTGSSTSKWILKR